MENEKEVEGVEEELDATGESDGPETDWKAEAIKARGMYKRMQTKYIKATEKKIEPPAPKEEPKAEKPEVKEEPKKSGLDNADYAYLAVKGIEDEDDAQFIYKIMQRWDKSLREVLNDDEVKAQLQIRKQERDTRAAIPTSTKRTGEPMSTLELDLAKFEKNGTLPTNFERRSAVINAKIEKENINKPAWRR